MKLSDTQSVILSEASQHELLLAPLPKLPKAAANAVLKSLLKNGLLAECPAPREHIGRAWRQDEHEAWIALRITEAGLRVIGVDPEEVAPVGGRGPATDAAPTGAPDAPPQGVPTEPAEATHGAPLANDTEEDDRPRHERNGVSDELVYGPADEDNGGLHPVTRARASLRDAAAALIQAWEAVSARGMDGGTEGRDDGVAAAIEQLRAALATKPIRAVREPGATRKPREGTKQEAVLAMLCRPQGATITQIREATGWQQHTVRGFFAGLKKRQGISVEVLERIRQVGPNKDGAKGSYTIYKIAR
jgi:hypothetical protein